LEKLFGKVYPAEYYNHQLLDKANDEEIIDTNDILVDFYSRSIEII